MINFKSLKVQRSQEYKVLAYRILLAYVFYFMARALFTIYNRDLIVIDSIGEFMSLCWHGLVFDTTAILYINSLFILVSVLPFKINTSVVYQRSLFYLYFVTNIVAFATNFIDFIYYRFNFGRSTVAMMDSIAHESNKLLLFKNFLINYWHVFLLFFLLSYLWILLYNKVKLRDSAVHFNWQYVTTSLFAFLFIVTISIGGIRGDFKKSTRPINLLDASRYVKNIAQADVVLNTPFTIIRTAGSNNFEKLKFVSKPVIDSLIRPIKHYKNHPSVQPNVVVLILESHGREYFGSFNIDRNIPSYKSYAPFVDSLAQHSLVFSNAIANGHKSIHAMSSILAGIPSFKDAFTSSPYPKQKTESLVSTLESEGYTTSFFHGAPNGSMGFLGYSNILGIDKYYGKTEYNNDADFDGVWGIWDEPFLQYFGQEVNKQPQPFMATLFSVSSHEPYKIPTKYKGKFPKGDINMHQCIGYTDQALKLFFNKVKHQPWYQNTIFVLVGDHGNTSFYTEYKQEINKGAVLMMIFRPDGQYVGVDRDYAQQIDIYPTILDMIGYKKPFRSWGRSLIGDTAIPPFVVRYSANLYQFMSGNYICTFDGNKAVGFYDKKDIGLQANLISQRNREMDLLEIRCKAFLQDYMERIIDKKLAQK